MAQMYFRTFDAYEAQGPGKDAIKTMVKQRVEALADQKKAMIEAAFGNTKFLHIDSDKWLCPWRHPYISLNVSGVSSDWQFVLLNVGWLISLDPTQQMQL